MNRFCQFSYPLTISHEGRCPIFQKITMGGLVNPLKNMSAVNQCGQLKIYALVDRHNEKEQDFLIVGTSSSIPEEYIDRLHCLGTLLFNDGRHGYTIYWIKDEETMLLENPPIDEKSTPNADVQQSEPDVPMQDIKLVFSEQFKSKSMIVAYAEQISQQHDLKKVTVEACADSPYIVLSFSVPQEKWQDHLFSASFIAQVFAFGGLLQIVVVK